MAKNNLNDFSQKEYFEKIGRALLQVKQDAVRSTIKCIMPVLLKGNSTRQFVKTLLFHKPRSVKLGNEKIHHKMAEEGIHYANEGFGVTSKVKAANIKLKNFQPTLILLSLSCLSNRLYLLTAVTASKVLITAENRAEAEQLNVDFLAIVRHNAGKYGKAVDPIHAPARVFRVPYTFNYKMGLENPKTVYMFEVNEIIHSVSELRAEVDRLLAEIPAQEKKNPNRPHS